LAGPASAQLVERLVDGIAAQVGSDVVLVSEVMDMAGPVEERMRAAQAPESEIIRMRADVLERLIEARLVQGVVRRLELDASEEEVNRAIRGIAQDTGLTLEQLAKSVTSHGLTFPEYKAKIRSEIERSKVVNTVVRSRVKVEPYEVEAQYAEQFSGQRSGGREVHVRHLLVPAGGDGGPSLDEACEVAAEARRRLEAGPVTFPELAGQLSAVARQRGGDIGWVHERDLASWMAKALAPLAEGDVSEVVRLPFGCNLLQLVERRNFERVTLEQARPAIEQEIFRGKMETEYTAWLEELRQRTYIERKDVFANYNP
ncbi:MAG: peptidylprolyl isomerase, partial [Proteobacteria bacterium]|nr:peptidylprolyl isomerase [Pseudomonadota bacterium]